MTPDREGEKGSWGEIFRDGRGLYSALVIGGIAMQATQMLVIAIIMPTIVADIGGAAYYTWAAMLYTIGAIVGASSTGVGRLVEVAMQEAAYPTLTSQLEAYWRTGEVPPRTGNASHNRVPINVYAAKDGYVAMNLAVEEHWHNLLAAMGREDLRDDPRFSSPAARVENRELVDATITEWTKTLGKMEIFAIAKQRRIPLAPVRDVGEVMHDPHMHERGYLDDIEHDEIGPITVPTSPLRFHGADRRKTSPSPKLGQHNEEIYGGWLDLSVDEIAELKADGVI